LLELPCEVASLEVLHHDERLPRALKAAHVEHPAYVLPLHERRCPGFAYEPLDHGLLRAGRQHLDRHELLELEVEGRVHEPYPAASDALVHAILPLDDVAGEIGSETTLVMRDGQCTIPMRPSGSARQEVRSGKTEPFAGGRGRLRRRHPPARRGRV
jgi:hypothetical protein